MKQPFARFLSIMSALSGLMGAGMSRMDAVSLSGAANYKSRGKGRGGRQGSSTTTAQIKRASIKARNVKRSRRFA